MRKCVALIVLSLLVGCHKESSYPGFKKIASVAGETYFVDDSGKVKNGAEGVAFSQLVEHADKTHTIGYLSINCANRRASVSESSTFDSSGRLLSTSKEMNLDEAPVITHFCGNAKAEATPSGWSTQDQALQTAVDSLVKWDMSCEQQYCLLHTDHPAPDDPGQFVSIGVAFDRATRKPIFFDFHVNPLASKPNGEFIAFFDRSGTMTVNSVRLHFMKCDQSSCMAVAKDGIIRDEDGGADIDLLPNFLNSHLIGILYLKNGRHHDTFVSLESFKKAYQQFLDKKKSGN